jgi:hypothetical protein
MHFKMDSQIPEWQHPVLQESAIEALSIYETMSKKKKGGILARQSSWR